MPQSSNRNADVLNISVKIADNLINKVEDAITELTIKREEIEIDLKTKYDAYMAVKAIDDKYLAQIEEEKLTLDTLVHWKTNTNPNKKVKVFTKISNTVGHKVKKQQAPRIPWARFIVETLQKQQRFLSFEDLYNQIVKDHPTLQISSEKQYKYNVKGYLVIQTKTKDSLLAQHDNLFGLKAWIKDNVVLPMYIKEFMHPH